MKALPAAGAQNHLPAAPPQVRLRHRGALKVSPVTPDSSQSHLTTPETRPQAKEASSHDGREAPNRGRASPQGKSSGDSISSQSSDEDTAPRRERSKPPDRGSDYHHIIVKGNARSQLGNTYIKRQTVYSGTFPGELEQGQGRARRTTQTDRDDFIRDLGFAQMGSRLANITAPHSGTCLWIFDTLPYLRWLSPHYRTLHYGFLWIKGKPGAGKSTLMKCAMEHLGSSGRHDVTVLSFFFNARGHRLEKTTQGMYRSLLHQLFTQLPTLLPQSTVESWLVERKRNWSVLMLQNMLRDAVLGLRNDHRLVLFIDALDECQEDSIRDAVQFFESLGGTTTSRDISFSICFASRHYPRISISHHESINIDAREEHHEDISIYVHEQLLGFNLPFMSELEDEISHRSSGVFLWTVLALPIVKKKIDHGETRSQVFQELERVPVGINDLLRAIVIDRTPFFLPTMQWVLFSNRPLSLVELYLGVMASAGQLDDWATSKTTERQMYAFLIASSKGLIEFSERWDHFIPTKVTTMAQFIHESVREYLLQGGMKAVDDTLGCNLQAKSHALLGAWCQIYLERILRQDSVDITDIATLYIDKTAQLQGSSTDIYDSQHSYHMHSYEWEFSTPLLSYALNNVLLHMETAFVGKAFQLASLAGVPWKAWALLLHAPGGGSVSHRTPVMLYALVVYHCKELTKAMLRDRLARLSPAEGCKARSTNLVDELPGDLHDSDINAVVTSVTNHPTVLLAAVAARLSEIVELLLECKAKPDLEVGNGGPPLYIAIESTACDCVRMLLKHGADASAPIHGKSPIALASRVDANAIVRVLLENGADPNSESLEADGVTLLADVAGTSNVELASILLTFGANVDGKATCRPLFSAAACNRISMTRLLLDSGADVNARNTVLETALHQLASRKDHRLRRRLGKTRIKIARDLLDAGADVNAMDCHSRSPLYMASLRGRFGLVRLFVDRGVDCTIASHQSIVQRLAQLEIQYPEADLMESDSNASMIAHGSDDESCNGNEMVHETSVHTHEQREVHGSTQVPLTNPFCLCYLRAVDMGVEPRDTRLRLLRWRSRLAIAI